MPKDAHSLQEADAENITQIRNRVSIQAMRLKSDLAAKLSNTCTENIDEQASVTLHDKFTLLFSLLS